MERRLSTLDISWFLDQRRNGQINLDPPYQRKSVWSPRDRRYFLDTIFRSYPSPAIFLYKRMDENGQNVYDVVDGKQRLETVFRFVDNQFAIAPTFGDSRFDSKKWRDLDDSLKRILWDYVVPIEYIKVVEGNVVNEVFARLNRNSRKLEPQEIRHARNDGWFIGFVEREAENDAFWKRFKITTTARSRRMKDVQFISELLLILLDNQVAGFDQDALDAAYARFDVPEEDDPEFAADEITARFSEVKGFLNAMEEANGCVRSYADTLNHFNSLWAWIALSPRPLPDASLVAVAYAAFMERVENLRKQPNLETLLAEKADDPEFSAPYTYMMSSTGASTEPAQRIARRDVLYQVLPTTVIE